MRAFPSACSVRHVALLAGMLTVAPACGPPALDSSRGVVAPLPSAAETRNPRNGLDPRKSLRQFARSVWRSQNGLPQNAVQAIVQRRDRYIWLATQEGMARFDGLEFEIFDRKSTPGLPHNDITALCEIDADQLWVGTAAGQVVLLTRGRAQSFEPLKGLERAVTALLVEEGGGLWIGLSVEGLGYFDGTALTRFDARAGLPDSNVRTLHRDRAGVLWVGTTAGLARQVEGARGSFAEVSELRGRRVQALASDDRGTLWVGTADGLVALSGASSTTYREKDGLSSASILSLRADRFGNLWIGTSRGLNRLRDGRIDWIDAATGLSDNEILSLLVDYEGSVWAGTGSGGLIQFREPRVTTYDNPPGISNNFYTVASSKDGGAWAGTLLGDVSRFDGLRLTRVLGPAETGGVRIRALYEDKRGVLWIGTDGELFSYAGGRISRTGSQGGLPDGPTRAIGEDRTGALWVGVNGAGLFRIESGRAVRYGPDRGIRSTEVRTIFLARSGELWVGTYGGLSVLRDGQFVTYTDTDGLSHNYVRALTEDETGALWIATYGGGLTRLRDGVFTRYTDLDGLLSNTIYSVQLDGTGHLWMSCNRGIFTVGLDELDLFAARQIKRINSTAFTEADGMRNRECNGGSPAGSWLGGGRLAFATLDGLAVVEPATLRQEPVPPAVVLRGVVADGVAIDRGGAQVLPPRPERIEFHFAGLDYSAPERVRFRYMMEGFDRGWVDAGATRLAQYTKLPPGAYTFRVAASNRVGLWSVPDAEYRFAVQPAFYQRTDVRVGTGAALLLFVFGSVRWRIAQHRRNARILQQRVEEALAHIKVLRGLLPICASCKKIRDDHGSWNRIEEYVREHTEVTFSHGLCPECAHTLYPDLDLSEGEGAGGANRADGADGAPSKTT